MGGFVDVILYGMILSLQKHGVGSILNKDNNKEVNSSSKKDNNQEARNVTDLL